MAVQKDVDDMKFLKLCIGLLGSPINIIFRAINHRAFCMLPGNRHGSQASINRPFCKRVASTIDLGHCEMNLIRRLLQQSSGRSTNQPMKCSSTSDQVQQRHSIGKPMRILTTQVLSPPERVQTTAPQKANLLKR